jgi:hypothetical protein
MGSVGNVSRDRHRLCRNEVPHACRRREASQENRDAVEPDNYRNARGLGWNERLERDELKLSRFGIHESGEV